MACVTGIDPAVIEKWEPREMATAEHIVEHMFGDGSGRHGGGDGGSGGGLRRKKGAFGNV